MGRQSDAKARLLEAAMDLIWCRSYGAVTVEDICEAAGVKKGSFYYFFKSRDELVAAALDAKWEEGRRIFDEIFSPTRPPLERLQKAFEHVYERQKELREKHGHTLGCPFSSVGTEVVTADKALRDAVARTMKGKLRYFESALRDLQAEGQLHGQDPAELARQVYSYYEGVLAQARIVDDVDLLRGVYAGALKLLNLQPSHPQSSSNEVAAANI
jgi:TetR/AcrR family transcriptional repressor of nem operon